MQSKSKAEPVLVAFFVGPAAHQKYIRLDGYLFAEFSLGDALDRDG